MSYIVIKVYNFECDWPDCNVNNIDVVPIDPATLPEAVKILRRVEHWTVKNGKHYCRKH